MAIAMATTGVIAACDLIACLRTVQEINTANTDEHKTMGCLALLTRVTACGLRIASAGVKAQGGSIKTCQILERCDFLARLSAFFPELQSRMHREDANFVSITEQVIGNIADLASSDATLSASTLAAQAQAQPPP